MSILEMALGRSIYHIQHNSIFWMIFDVIRPVSYAKWVFWKKRARLAILNKQTTQCRICHNHIFPGQQVVKVQHENTHPGEFLVHIDKAATLFSLGGNFSLKTRYRECALLCEGQKNLGIWDGFQFISNPNSIQVG
ncbi:MAG: hypothetical protein Q8Q89_04245 [bacterium]|nr:hypothetical protein [bacterium]